MTFFQKKINLWVRIRMKVGVLTPMWLHAIHNHTVMLDLSMAREDIITENGNI